MAKKYGKKSQDSVESAMKRRNKGTLKRGKQGHGGKVTNRKQAIAIGLSEARKEGAKVPKRPKNKSAAKSKKTSKKTSKKKSTKKAAKK